MRGSILIFNMTVHHRSSWWRKHSLTLVATAILGLWIVLYSHSSPDTHAGSFFGNAIADWSGVVVMVIATKYLYEKGSAESKRPPVILQNRIGEILRDHSLTIFLLVTGAAWLALFLHMEVL